MTLRSTRGSDGLVSRGGESECVSRPEADEAVEDSEGEVEAAVRELLEIGDDAAFEARCHEFDHRFPHDVRLAGARIRHLIQKKAFDQALEAIGQLEFGERPEHRMLNAELLFDAHDADGADEVYAPLLAELADSSDIPMRRNAYLSYAKRLLVNGHLLRAHAMLGPILDSLPEGTQSEAVANKAQALVKALEELEGAPLPEGRDERITAMKHAILSFRNRKLRPRKSAAIGKLSLITGSLGPGGAERQLSRLAVELERARIDHGSIGGVPVDEEVDVVVRSHGPEKQSDFYLADIHAAGITPFQINDLTPISPKNLGIEDPRMLLLLDYLPSSVNFGVKRLTRYFEEGNIDTASVWQDGACLFAGLAALIAGVPQIQLAIRGLPPSMRRHMYRPEYEVFYRAMAQIPGVTFVSNNISAARAYAEWLDIPLDRFSIVYNGVQPMCPDPSSECEQMWNRFVEQTPEATHTVGGVFRFDTDKQPLLWVRFAARYLKHHPDARIILVGGGRLLDNAVRLAEELGIDEHILFVGRSTKVGFWMTKMDVLVLMSRYEGLPNVLIEAQYMGVHVVTTPAGGSSECLINGTTGHVLDCAEKPDLEIVVRLTHELVTRDDAAELFGEGGIGRSFLDSHFSIPHMLAQYVTCTSNGLGPYGFEEAEALRSRRAA